MCFLLKFSLLIVLWWRKQNPQELQIWQQFNRSGIFLFQHISSTVCTKCRWLSYLDMNHFGALKKKLTMEHLMVFFVNWINELWVVWLHDDALIWLLPFAFPNLCHIGFIKGTQWPLKQWWKGREKRNLKGHSN